MRYPGRSDVISIHTGWCSYYYRSRGRRPFVLSSLTTYPLPHSHQLPTTLSGSICTACEEPITAHDILDTATSSVTSVYRALFRHAVSPARFISPTKRLPQHQRNPIRVSKDIRSGDKQHCSQNPFNRQEIKRVVVFQNINTLYVLLYSTPVFIR